MNIEELKNIFNNFVSTYDTNDIAIIRKVYHSYRVMDFCILIGKDNNFNNEDMDIATLIGLLHDYARFEQWSKYTTYDDNKSVDHGDLAVKMLFDDNEIINYCNNKEYYDIIYKAIKYHNKYDYPIELSERDKMFCNLIRDADKIDIFYLLGIYKDLLKEDDEPISDEIKKAFYEKKLISHSMAKNESDKIVLKLAMVFDLNFEFSYNYLYSNKLIDRMFENIEDKMKFEPYFNYINDYIKRNKRS